MEARGRRGGRCFCRGEGVMGDGRGELDESGFVEEEIMLWNSASIKCEGECEEGGACARRRIHTHTTPSIKCRVEQILVQQAKHSKAYTWRFWMGNWISHLAFVLLSPSPFWDGFTYWGVCCFLFCIAYPGRDGQGGKCYS